MAEKEKTNPDESELKALMAEVSAKPEKKDALEGDFDDLGVFGQYQHGNVRNR